VRKYLTNKGSGLAHNGHFAIVFHGAKPLDRARIPYPSNPATGCGLKHLHLGYGQVAS
jgi:hypothetical protein